MSMEPPTLEQVHLHAAKIGLPAHEADKFWHYYEANGWKVGRAPMKKWEAALVHWRCVWQDRHGHSRGTNGNSAPLFARINSAQLLLNEAQKKLDQCNMWKPNAALYPEDYQRWLKRQAQLMQERQRLRNQLQTLHQQQLGL